MLDIFGDIYSLRSHEFPSGPTVQEINNLLHEEAKTAIIESLNSLLENLRGKPVLRDERSADAASSAAEGIDREILRARAVMLATQRHIGKHIEGLCKKRNSLSSFFKLPPEVVGDVLAAALPEPSALQRNVSDRLFSNPNAFYHVYDGAILKSWASVSSAWLRLVRGCPKLWTIIGWRPEGDLNLLSIQLQRSGTLPISIPSWPNKTDNGSSEMVLQHARRFRYVTLAAGENNSRDRAVLISRFMDVPMPFLERLELWFWCDQNLRDSDGGDDDTGDDGSDDDEEDDGEQASNTSDNDENGENGDNGGDVVAGATYEACTIGGGPRFTELLLRNTLIHPESVGLLNLHTLEVAVPSKHDHLDLLPMLAPAINLRSLTVYVSRDLRTFIGSLPKWPEQDFLEMSSLRHLSIDRMSGLALYLHTPAIRSLTASHYDPGNEPYFEELLKPNRVIFDFLSSTNPTLLQIDAWDDGSCRLRLPDKASYPHALPRDESDNLTMELSRFSISSRNVNSEAFKSFLHALPPIAFDFRDLPDRYREKYCVFQVVSVRLPILYAATKLQSALIGKVGGRPWIWPQLREIRITETADLDAPDEPWVTYLGLELREQAARKGLVSHWTVYIEQSTDDGATTWEEVYTSEA